MLVAAPLASFIPLAALAGLLAVVAWNMAEKHEIATLLRASRGDAVVLLVTFLLVVFRDLTEGILVGFGIGALLFLHRMAQAIEVEQPADARGGSRRLRRRRRPHALRRGARDRPRHRGLPHLRRVLLRCRGRGRGGARSDRRAPEGLCDRCLGRAAAQLDRRRDDRGLCAQGAPARRPGLHLRRAFADPARAARAWCPSAAGALRCVTGRCGRGGAPGDPAAPPGASPGADDSDEPAPRA